MKQILENDKKNINYGFALLKMFMCLVVVWQHSKYFTVHSTINNIINFFSGIAVPVFMILSFIFLTPKIADSKYIRKRILSLLYLQVSWAIIYCLIDTFSHFIIHGEFNNLLNDFITQALFGVGLNVYMWFQFDLLILTILMYAVYKLFSNKKIRYIVMTIIFFVCLFLQSSKINFNIFSMFGDPLYHPFGKLVEMIPYAILGCILSEVKLFRETNTIVKITICIMLFLMIVLQVDIETYGFGYAGIRQMPIAILLIILFDFLNSKIDLKRYVNKYTIKYSTGIYCVHKLLLDILVKLELVFDFNITYDCLLIFFASYIVCFIIDKIPCIYTKKLIN